MMIRTMKKLFEISVQPATASLTADGVLLHPPLDALLPREQAKSAFLAH